MRRKMPAAVAFVGLVLVVPAQETGATLLARIRAGGWPEQAKYQRNAGGEIESWTWAHTGDPQHALFLPLIRATEFSGHGLLHVGAFGFLSLVVHGNTDLLAMTDAEFHFGALGLGSSDVELRQFLAVPPPSFDGALGRAELFDRLLAIDRLAHRHCRSATVELEQLAANEALPAVLRERARCAAACLRGEREPFVRRRLDPAAILLPAAFDGCIVIDHARLPDLRWLAPLGRRLGALATATAIDRAGGASSPATLNGAQRLCDVSAAAPFWVAHEWGNARVDHSIVTVSAKADGRMPVALTWNAAGEFEHERWAAAELPERVAANNPLLGGVLSVEAESLYASTDGSRGKARPAMAENLLRDDGMAIRVVVPANSKLWPALAFLKLPPATGAELRVAFGDPAVVVLVVEARNEDAADEWVAKGKELLAQANADPELLPPEWEEQPDLLALCRACLGASLSTKDGAAFAVVEVRGMTPAKITAIFDAAVTAGFR